MSGTLQRFGFDKLKDRLSLRRDKRPSTSASVPNLTLRFKKLRTLGRPNTLKSASLSELHGDLHAVGDHGVLAEDNETSDDSSSVTLRNSPVPSTTPLGDKARLSTEDETRSIDLPKPLQVTHTTGSTTEPDSDFDRLTPECFDQPGSSLAVASTSSASVYSTESLGSPINLSANSPVDQSIMETLEELDLDMLNRTLCLDSLEQHLDTIHEEDDTSVRCSTTVQSAASLGSDRSSPQVLPSNSSPGISATSTRSLFTLQEGMPYTTTAPQPPANTPVDGVANFCAMQSLPTIPTLLFAACVAAEDVDKLATKSYIRMLPPLVRMTSFDFEGPALNLYLFMCNCTDGYAYHWRRAWKEDLERLEGTMIDID